jgi:hypothetical protein
MFVSGRLIGPTGGQVRLAALEAIPITLMTARGAASARVMLDRGFTTVCDAGGDDWGISGPIRILNVVEDAA